MDTILHNAQCWLTSDGRLEVYNARLATRINRYLGWYMDGRIPYAFKDDEEALFRLSQVELNEVLHRFLVKKHAIR